MNEPDHTLSATYSRFAQACAGLAGGIALLALIGWITGFLIIAQIAPNGIPMAPSTAIALILTSLGLVVRARWPESGLSRAATSIAAVIVLCLSGFLLAQFVGGFELGLEDLLVNYQAMVQGSPVGHMSPISAAAFLLANLILLALSLLSDPRRTIRDVAGSMALIIMAIALVMLVGYAFGTPLLYGGSIIPVALPTAAALLVVGLGILTAVGPRAWPVRLFVGPSVRARMLRILLPTVLVSIVGVGLLWNVLLQAFRNNYALALSLQMVISMAVFGVVVVLIARSLGGEIDMTEAAEKQAREALRESEARLLKAQTDAHIGNWEWNPVTNEVYWSEENYRIFGLDSRKVTPSVEAFIEAVTPAEREFVRTSIAEALSGKKSYDIDIHIIRPDGTSGIANARAQVDFDAEGKAIRLAGTVQDITGRKQVEEMLRETESHLRAILSNALITIFATDSHGVFTFSEGKGLEQVGLKPGQNIGASAFDLYGSLPFVEPTGKVTAGKDVIRRALAGESVNAFNELHGVYFENHIGPLRGADGKVVGIVGVATDITERKRAEEKHRQSEEELKEAQALGRIGSWEFDVVDQKITWSDQTYRLYERDPAKGPPSGEEEGLYYAPEQTMKLREYARLAIEEGKEFSYELELRLPSGKHLFCAATMRPKKDGQGQVVKLFGTVQDITERKRAEEALLKAKEFGEAVLNNIHDSISIIDVRDFRIVGVNEVFLRTNVVKREEAMGKFCYEVTHGRSTLCTGPGGTCPIQDMLSSRKPTTVEHVHNAPNGRSINVEVSAYPLMNSRGEIVQAVHVTHDISERRQAEEERRNLELQVQHSQKLESLGVLAGGIAHDFNNLLMVILGNTDIALRRLSPVSPVRPQLQAIEKASRRATNLTNQMLAYSGRGAFQVKKVDLSETVEEMAHLLEASISKKVHLERVLAHGLPPVEADVAQMQQVVMNLIINASEAIGDDTVGEVVVDTGVVECDDEFLRHSRLPEKCPPGRYVFLRVRDTGCGMEEEIKAKLFDPFYSTKFTGRGLGLAAVLGIVRGHRGAIILESEVGKGSTFTILFPALEEKLVKVESGEPGQVAEWKGAGTVLIAEDEEAVSGIVSQMLRDSGFSILTAMDGQEAVEVFKAHADEITVVLLDLTMPRMSGEEVFEEIRRIRGDARVVLSSGYSQEELKERFRGKRVEGYLQKPYRYESLVSTIAQVVKR